MHKKLMWMEEKICSVKGKSQSGLCDSKMYWQHKMAKRKENQLGILEIYTYCQKFQQRAWGPGKSAARVTIYLWEYTRKVTASSP